MEVYIDKSFMSSFFSIEDCEILQHFQNFLEEIGSYDLITNFHDYEEMLGSFEAALFCEIMQNKGKLPNFVFKPELKWENLFTTTSTGGYKIYLWEPTDNSNYISRNFGYVNLNCTNCIEVWRNFTDGHNTNFLLSVPPDKYDSDVFNGWEDLKFINKIPTNSILIVDNYILSDKSNSKIKDNLFPLLEHIIPIDFNGNLYISILTKDFSSNDNELFNVAKKIHNKLHSHFSKFSNIKFTFNILHNNKAFNPSDNLELHDRYIYTNYFTIDCQKGFNLFSNKKRNTYNSDVKVLFNFERYNLKKNTQNLLALKKYIKKLEKLESIQFKSYPNKITIPLLQIVNN